MTEIKNKSVAVFLDELASKSSTPGGGSAAALMGAQSAALTSMVCNLTIGKPQYEQVDSDMKALLIKSEALREKLTDMIKADVEIFNRVMASYGLPKNTEEEKEIRSAEIQEALKLAADVPLNCARACAEVIELSREAAEKGNRNVISDAGVAVMAAFAALKSAALNVYINAGGIKDNDFVDARISELDKILQGAGIATEEVYQLVKNKL